MDDEDSGGVGCGGVVSEGGGAHLDMGQMGQTISFFSCFLCRVWDRK
jgi:hypothetical protein